MLWNEFGKAVERGRKHYDEAMNEITPETICRREIYETSSSESALKFYDNFSYNRFFVGDNRDVMITLLKGNEDAGIPSYKGKIRMIYIDPPFDSQRLYHYQVNIGFGENAGMLRQIAYCDRFDHATFDYLEMLTERLYYMKDLLTDDGSILVHIDYHISHYVKLLLDEIFGRNRFVNEIVWCYGGGGAPKKHYTRKHDVILWYTKGKDWYFKPQYRPYSKGTIERGLTAVKGERYELHREGATLDDWWSEPEVQKILSPTAKENAKYETQKPEGLLHRIIEGHSAKGDIIADFFCGSGTTGVVAEKMDRRWIMADMSEAAYRISRRRIIEMPVFKPFEAIRMQKIVRDGNENIEIDVKVQETLGGLVLVVSLIDFKINEAELKGMSSKQRKMIDDQQKIDWLQLIEFWDVDSDYCNNEIFHSDVRSIRLYQGKKQGVKSVDWQLFVPLNGTRDEYKEHYVAIRVVDILGYENFLTFRI